MHLKQRFTLFDATLLRYGNVGLAYAMLRFRKSQLPQPYGAWGYPAISFVFICFYIWIAVRRSSVKPLTSFRDLAMVISGLPFFLIWSTINKF
jgi:hypothetical protein